MTKNARKPGQHWAQLAAMAASMLLAAGAATAQQDTVEMDERTPIFSEEQHEALREAHEADIRETLGLEDGVAPNFDPFAVSLRLSWC